ncbi:hypothetical protein JTB14_012827 [Gonioctena quinquepunctata]|nr:hypothetical protein JTB14_012827 [Gonioctena quinquepunctata]
MDSYELIPVEETYGIFNMTDELDNSFFLDFRILSEDSILIMPLHINRNHWCIIIIEIKNKKFLFIDPRGSESPKQADRLKNICLVFLERYNSIANTVSIETNSWEVEIKPHFKQTDTFSCGVLIVYMVEEYIRQRSLLEPVDVIRFRTSIKTLLLKASNNMKDICMICGYKVGVENSCRYCERSFHNDCTILRESICDLCKDFKKNGKFY